MVNGAQTENSFSICLSISKKFDCTNAHTLCYRLDGNEGSVNKEFFIEGNAINERKYEGQFPWKNQRRMISIEPGISIVE